MNLTLNNISYCYGKHPALRAVSATFAAGDMVALVGQNGSGKSTLLKCINRVVEPTEGEVYINGVPMSELSLHKISEIVAYVPQYAEPVRFSTVFDMVLLGRKPYMSGAPTKYDYAKVARAITLMGLQELAMRRVEWLSGGERQRVMIARAIAQEPSVILLDEPIANLDIKHQFAVMKLLRELSQSGTIVVVAIHDLAQAAHFCNKTIMLKNGEMFAFGGDEVYSRKNINGLFDIEIDSYGTDYFNTHWLCSQ